MPELKFNIGLDFGTYQSKACLFHTSATPQKHEFVQFPVSPGGASFVIPSRVYKMNNDTFEYGFPSSDDYKAMFTYFKIASAEDEHFRVVTDLDKSKSVYLREEFREFSPEFLSVLYITYVSMVIKEGVRKENTSNIKTGFFGKPLSQETTKILFTTQLGIPTEYSKKINLMRRRKFENILLVSEMLQEEIPSLSDFKTLKVKQTISLVKDCLTIIKHSAKDLIGFTNLLNKYGVSVYPEAAAGLTFLVKTRRLEPGHYVALDIGGGSSDLSFFAVTPENRIKYLASEAFMTAANDIYKKYSGKSTPSFTELQLAEKEMTIVSQSKNWSGNQAYLYAVEWVTTKLYNRLYHLFNERVYWYFSRFKGTMAFKNQPCFVFGGGARLPIIDHLNQICIHDNGQSANVALKTIVKRTNLDNYLPNVGILPADNSWRNDFGLLVVAFGLSFPHRDDEAYWDPSEYTPYSPKHLKKPKLVPHPFNEDLYIYDVIEAKWRT
jgi:hypothetical protein